MMAPPPMVAVFLSALMLTWFRPARLMRTPVVPRLNWPVAHPLPPFWATKGIFLLTQYLTYIHMCVSKASMKVRIGR